jgi:hypothetical protein
MGTIMESQVTDWGASLMGSLTSAMSLFFAAIPRLFGFIVIVIVGWIVSALLAKAIAMLLRKAHFNQLAERSGFADFVSKTGTETDSAGMIASIANWFVRLIVLVVAFDALGLPAVSEVLRDLLLWLPNLAVALVVLVIGGIAANAVSKLVRGMTAEADLDNPDFLAKLASMAVWAFTVVVAVSQIGVATTLVNMLFMAVVGAFALALGLAFGLGGRDTASDIIRNWDRRARTKRSKTDKEVPADRATDAMPKKGG